MQREGIYEFAEWSGSDRNDELGTDGDIFKRCISVLWRFSEKNHIDAGNRDRMYDSYGAYLQWDIRK